MVTDADVRRSEGIRFVSGLCSWDAREMAWEGALSWTVHVTRNVGYGISLKQRRRRGDNIKMDLLTSLSIVDAKWKQDVRRD